MMGARADILAEYTVEDGIIRDLGRYESEPLFAPYFYDATLDGCGEELSFMEDGCGEYAALVEVTDEDRTEFPELGSALYVLVRQSEQGFVLVESVETEAEAERIREEYEPEEEEEEPEDEEE